MIDDKVDLLPPRCNGKGVESFGIPESLILYRDLIIPSIRDKLADCLPCSRDHEVMMRTLLASAGIYERRHGEFLQPDAQLMLSCSSSESATISVDSLA
ncbi:hypothetical protein M8J77_024046 [Diaphorina citri]|nr:hypothetical protein M8J77_024046 [Diaphorina citri]